MLRVFAILSILAVICAPANATLVVASTPQNQLITFDTATPGSTSSGVTITGLQAGESIMGIDFRPADGILFGLGSTSRLYTINFTTGVATLVGSAGAFTLSGMSFGFDFNPTVDRIRVTSNLDQNLRLNPNDGTLTATDGTLAYAAGDPNFGLNPNIAGSAYTNSFTGAPASTTTLYGIDSNFDILAIQNPPNAGTLNTVGALGVNTSDLIGFDILAAGNIGYASLTVPGGFSSFYQINLATGAATLIGSIGTGRTISGIALVQPPVPEPGTLALVLLGMAGLVMARRSRCP